jgi:hypothetical protein
MIPIMLSVGLFDMRASGVLLTYFALRRAIFWMILFLAPVGVDVRRVVSLLELFAASHLVVECLKLLAPLF